MNETFDAARFKQTTRQQWDSAAAAWHAWGPTIRTWLGPATDVMVELAGIGPGARVLDVAAGAGDQTLTIAQRVGPSGSVLATDISPAILELCARDARQAGLTGIETRCLDGEHLDVPPASFDAAVSRVGLIYFPDRGAALRGIYQALKPGAKLAAVVYSTADRNEFFSVPISIIRRAAGLGPPPAGRPGPFSLATPDAIRTAYEEAGFHDVRIETVPSPLRLSTAAECVRFERESFGALHEMMTNLSEQQRLSVWQEIEAALKRFETPSGFVGPCEMLVAAGTR